MGQGPSHRRRGIPRRQVPEVTEFNEQRATAVDLVRRRDEAAPHRAPNQRIVTFGICVNCGDVGEMERAHIIPKLLGGKGVVLLCASCHAIQHGVEWEGRQNLSELTRLGLAAKKANGARLGRPVSEASRPARARLRELLHERLTFAAIATTLNAEGYTTPTGLAWTWRHVQKTRDSLILDGYAIEVQKRRPRKPREVHGTYSVSRMCGVY